MNPIDQGDLYDVIEVAGKRSPGIVTLSGHDRNEKWDVKEPDGAGGGSSTWKGEKLVQFTASFLLVKDVTQGIDDFADWESFTRHLRTSIPNSGKPKALPIYHPDLAAPSIAVKNVCIESISGLVHDGKGGASASVKFIEYRPPKKKGGSPLPKPAVSKPDPNADLKAQIDALLAEARKP